MRVAFARNLGSTGLAAAIILSRTVSSPVSKEYINIYLPIFPNIFSPIVNILRVLDPRV